MLLPHFQRDVWHFISWTMTFLICRMMVMQEEGLLQ